jgi:hypothetical protein
MAGPRFDRPVDKIGEAKPRRYRIYLTGGGYIDREAGLSVEATIRDIIKEGFVDEIIGGTKIYYPPHKIDSIELSK